MSERRVVWRGLALPKRGHGAAEYEDAFAGDPVSGRFAIADGATESPFAGAWARALVAAFVGSEPPWLDAARRTFAAELAGQTLPWYLEAKRDEGGHATFLGIVVRGATWRALAVGDSCLFHLRDGGRLEAAFPLGFAADFGRTPELLRSVPVPQASRERSGSWLPGDRLLLATDALAEWLLRRHEAGDPPWHDLPADDDFTAWVERRRERDGLRNDDVTLVEIGYREPN